MSSNGQIDSWIHQFRTRAKLSFSNTLCSTIQEDYEILFQPLFDEYFNPPPHVVSPVLADVAASRAVDPAGSPSSNNIDQDVPSANNIANENVPSSATIRSDD
nr:hypothetical protein [Tanacetum cinerariifolium]